MAIDVLKQLDERIQASVARIHQLRKENEQLAQKLAEMEKRYADASGMAHGSKKSSPASTGSILDRR
jgi:FtsZ-binding cell division protein ZapB